MQVGALIPGWRNPYPQGPSKVPEKEISLMRSVPKPWKQTDRHLVVSWITTGYHIEIIQYRRNVSLGAFVYHEYEFGIEHVFHIEFTYIGRIVHCLRYKHKNMLQSHCHSKFITRRHLFYRRLKVAGDGNGYSLETTSISVPTIINCAAAR